MKIIVPMAGMGKRMRPHTLTTPKPLIPIAGKSIVHRLVEDIAKSCGEKVDEVAFIVGRFGTEVEKNLLLIAENIGAKASIYYQDEAKGTAHALLCSRESLNGKIIVAFADTLFKADFKLDDEADGVIWVQQVENPRSFGVVKVDQNNRITDFVEKPEHFVSNLAIIGIYYFKDASILLKELDYLIDQRILDKGEYQLTSALENMKAKGFQFQPGKVQEWLDCGNKDSTVHSNTRVLEFDKDLNLISGTCKKNNSIIIPPCFIGENVELINSVIGPYASIGNNTVIEDSVISSSIIQSHSRLSKAHIHNSMIGNYVHFKDCRGEMSIGDYSTQNN